MLLMHISFPLSFSCPVQEDTHGAFGAICFSRCFNIKIQIHAECIEKLHLEELLYNSLQSTQTSGTMSHIFSIFKPLLLEANANLDYILGL